MFLFQKLNYEHYHLTDDSQVALIEEKWEEYKDDVQICGFDTETTGLHYITSVPFLYIFGFGKVVFTFEPTEILVNKMIEVAHRTQRLFAHNAKFDYHMTWNFLGNDVTKMDDIIGDSMSVARLTGYADDEERIGLESLGAKYVDPDSKFAGKVIKKRITEINRERKNIAKSMYYSEFGRNGKFKNDWDAFHSMVKYVNDDTETNQFFKENYHEANYYDVYKADPNLVICYATDDVVIMLEYLKKALPVLCGVDEGLRTFNRECKLISAIARMEQTGIKLDIDYALKSRDIMLNYRAELYDNLYKNAGCNFSVGQHDFIKKMFKLKFNRDLESADKKHLEALLKDTNVSQQEKQIVEDIIELRTVEKWLSTYIDGKLNNSVNGRIYTNLNNSGAVSGRVSCDMQQEPKEPFRNRNGEVLFNPRKMFIPDDGFMFVFEDMSQMELRVQAFYTIKTGNADTNLCRAYMPYKCTSCITGEVFDPKIQGCLDRWNSGEWMVNDTDFWQPTDLHTLTTFTAFPFLNHDINHPEFKHYRRLGKMCNFLKNYQGGIGAIMSQLDVSEDIAQKLDNAYYTNFPGVKGYQDWVNTELLTKGYVANLYGRKYFMKSAKNYYKACNYVIQGSCADMIKIAELKLDKLLEGKKSKFVLPIHDEFMVLLAKDEQYLIPQIKLIMQDTRQEMPWMPMISDVEVATKSWGDKYDWNGKEVC